VRACALLIRRVRHYIIASYGPPIRQLPGVRERELHSARPVRAPVHAVPICAGRPARSPVVSILRLFVQCSACLCALKCMLPIDQTPSSGFVSYASKTNTGQIRPNKGWGPRGLSLTSRTVRGQKVVVLALALVMNILYSNTCLVRTRICLQTLNVTRRCRQIFTNQSQPRSPPPK